MRWREFGGDGGVAALERIGLIRFAERTGLFLSFHCSVGALASCNVRRRKSFKNFNI